MTVILHLSDTHFGTEEGPWSRALQALVREVKPVAAILSGDITQRARRAQFAAARAFCDSLRVDHLLTLPGNHDIPLYNLAARLFAPYRGYARAFGHNLEPELEFADVLVVGVNTTPAGAAQGRRGLPAADPARVRAAARRPARAAAHRGDAPAGLRDAAGGREGPAARRRGGGAGLVARGADLVLGGHIHLPYVSDVCAR
jgi:predicted phosphodiesterase